MMGKTRENFCWIENWLRDREHREVLNVAAKRLLQKKTKELLLLTNSNSGSSISR